MQTSTMNKISMVSGGCEEYCWGDFEVGGLADAVAGSVAGVAGAAVGAVGAVGGAVAYLLDVVWTD